MKMKSILLASAALMATAAMAQAADLPTKKGVAPAPAKIACWDSFSSWFNNSAADCPLSEFGFTFYGQIDVGAGYNTHASAFNPAYPNGIAALPANTSKNGAWQWVPNGLSQSNLGLKWKEKIANDWYIIGDINFGFDPYSLQFSDGPNSLEQNNSLAQINRTSNGDSSRAYGPINARAYGGISNATFGTLTYGRQYAISTDNDNTYDPFGGAYAFSMIGNSGTLGGGFGDTELARLTNSIKYAYANNGVRASVISAVGGWAAGNNAQYQVQGDLGFDYAGFSMDGLYSYSKDAVALGVFGSNPTLTNAAFSSQTLKATIENVSAFQIVGKYKWNQFTLFGGYQYDRLTNPSDLPTSASLAASPVRAFNDGYPAVYGSGVQGANAFPVAKVLQVLWVGGKVAVLPTVDVATGYYHVWQNDYLGTTQTAAGATSCIANTGANPVAGGTLKGTMSSKCAGTEDVISGMIDWHMTKRFDVYGGVMAARVTGGLASGFYADSNISTTVGVRLSF